MAPMTPAPRLQSPLPDAHLDTPAAELALLALLRYPLGRAGSEGSPRFPLPYCHRTARPDREKLRGLPRGNKQMRVNQRADL
jgi:hypothetical protein